MDAVELLRRMRGACKTKCFCELYLDSGDNLVLRWSGALKINKDGDKKDWGAEVVIAPWQLRRPNHLDQSLEDAEKSMARLFKEMAEGEL